MPGLGSTIARLKSLKIELPANVAVSRLSKLTNFGANPGSLAAHFYVPDDLPVGAPLVVVLHGCTQNAAGYDYAAGWSRAADEFGFALLFPEQQRANNPNLCFNWFSPSDTQRGHGETESIREMIRTMGARFKLDGQRVFITGLSAGGAMTAVMLATYPEIFSAGAVIAGLPFGVAHSVPQALERMRGQGLASASELTSLVKAASAGAERWPRLAVWHGTVDQTVHPSNGQALVDQWRGLMSLPAEPTRRDRINGHLRCVWDGPDGQPFIEHVAVSGLAHGTPLSSLDANSHEHATAHMLEAGVSSTQHILASWGLKKERRLGSEPSLATARLKPTIGLTGRRVPSSHRPEVASPITRTIESALRKAGLLR